MSIYNLYGDQFPGGPPPFQTWPRSVALYSGGVDSYCMAYLHQPDLLLHVRMGGRYGAAEQRHLRVPDGMDSAQLVSISFPLGRYEHPDTKIIPGRNAMLALLAAQYGDNILMGSVAGSSGFDKDDEFAARMNQLFKHMFQKDPKWLPDGRVVRLHLPVNLVTKAQLVGAVLATGHDPEELVARTFSCYEPEGTNACGKCPACARKWAAFTVWGVDVGFNGRDAFQPYWQEILDGRTQHRTAQFLTDVADAWHGFIRIPGIEARTAATPPKIGDYR